VSRRRGTHPSCPHLRYAVHMTLLSDGVYALSDSEYKSHRAITIANSSFAANLSTAGSDILFRTPVQCAFGVVLLL
jgi:hypothetical protein